MGICLRQLVWLVVLLIPRIAWSMSVLPLNLQELTSQAGIIFEGTCLSVEPDQDENGLPVTWIRFQVEDGLKGAVSGKTVLVKQYGLPKAQLHVGEGEQVIVPLKGIRSAPANYDLGKDYFIFFYPESSLGMTSPVGGGQGYFEISSQGSGASALKTVVNPLDNQFLQTFGTGPVPIDRMKDEVKKLIEKEL